MFRPSIADNGRRRGGGAETRGLPLTVGPQWGANMRRAVLVLIVVIGVMLIASGAASASTNINSGAAYTTSRSVSVSYSGVAIPCQATIGNDSAGWNWGTVYGTPIAWTLTAGDGLKTVAMMFRNPTTLQITGSFSDTITLDTTSPHTTASGVPSGTVKSATISLSATDTFGSGVDYVEYSTGGGSWQRGTAVYINPPAQTKTTYQVSYRAMDRAGNLEAAHTFSVSVDTTTPAPMLSSFTPTSGPIGTSVTITGANLTGATALKFNGTSASYSVSSSTQVRATVPAGASTGRISVTTAGGTATSGANYTVTTPMPTISSLSPSSGKVGTSVTVGGTNLTGATSVKFGGTSATYSVNSPTNISATVPAGATSGKVTVTTAGGAAASSSNFTVIPTPTVSGSSPAAGPVGASVTISGTNLTGATRVTFSGVSASYSVSSSTQVKATVPTGATTGVIAVTTPGGTATSSSNFTVTPQPPAPMVVSFTPTSALVGASVTISGTNLTGATAVRFNGVSASYVVNGASQITARVPTGATSGPIAVTTPGGRAVSGSIFTVRRPAQPVLTRLSRSSGRRGSTVTLTGASFGAKRGTSYVKFGLTRCSTYTSWSAKRIVCKVPARAKLGAVKVAVRSSGGTSNAKSFNVRR
jgi:IPT/TIG domain